MLFIKICKKQNTKNMISKFINKILKTYENVLNQKIYKKLFMNLHLLMLNTFFKSYFCPFK